MNLDDFLNLFDWINRVQGFVWSLTSWWPRRRSHKGRKVGGLRVDGGTKRIEVDRKHSTGMEAERALKRAHIPIAGRGITSKVAYFLVRSRQYKWALYVLLRAGVVVSSPVPADVARWAGGQAGPVPLWGDEQSGRRESRLSMPKILLVNESGHGPARRLDRLKNALSSRVGIEPTMPRNSRYKGRRAILRR